MNTEPIVLKDIDANLVPERLRPGFYFDFQNHPFEHSSLFDETSTNSVVGALDRINEYATAWIGRHGPEQEEAGARILTHDDFPSCGTGRFRIVLSRGAVFKPGFITGHASETYSLYVGEKTTIHGANIYLDSGDIHMGTGNLIEPGAGFHGPCIVGDSNAIRQGAYFRGNVIIGSNGNYRGEIKSSVVMNDADFPHPSYVGDSICGYRTHFGNQATTANLGIYSSVNGRRNITISVDGKTYDLGRPKIGMIAGDFSQVGCNSVSDPGTFLGPQTIVYQLCRINKGFYGPREVLKNKPMERGIIERSGLVVDPRAG